MARPGIPTNVLRLSPDGNIEGIVSVRSGNTAALNAIVLKQNELAIELSAAGKPQALRGGDGAASGGFAIAGSNVINQVFGGSYPPVPESVSTSTWTDITNSGIATTTLGYVVNYVFGFSVPAACGLEFYWAPFRFCPIKIYGGTSGVDMTYFDYGTMTGISLADTNSGTFYVAGTGIALTGIEGSTMAKFRCKTTPGGSDKLRCTRFYVEYRNFGLLPP